MCISSFLPATDKLEFSHQLFAKGYPYYYVEKVYLNHFKELKSKSAGGELLSIEGTY